MREIYSHHNFNKVMYTKLKNSAFTLVELILTLAIIAILIAAVVLVTAREVTNRSKIRQSADNIMKIISAMNQAATAGDPPGSYSSSMDIDYLCTGGYLVTCNSSNKISDPWGGTYEISEQGSDGYVITINSQDYTAVCDYVSKISSAGSSTCDDTNYQITIGTPKT